MRGDYLRLTTQRLREMDAWSDANPPESGIVSIQRDPHGRFWQGVEATREATRAADAAVRRVGGKA